MTKEERQTRLSIQVKRLRDAADRLDAFVSLDIREVAIREETTFIEQVAYAIRHLALVETCDPKEKVKSDGTNNR